MPTAKERVKALAKEVKKAMKEPKAAEARVMKLGKQMVKAVAEAKAEVEAATRTILRYPSGRYECAGCRQSVVFSEATEELPECENCGSREYKGHEPEVIEIKPPPPKRYHAGMYQCDGCRARIALAEDTDDLPECDFCGGGKLQPIE